MSLFEVEGWGLENKTVKATESNRKLKKDKQIKRKEQREEKKAKSEKDDSDEKGGKKRKESESNKKFKKNKDEQDSDVEEDKPAYKKQKTELPPPMDIGIDASKLTPLQRKMLSKLSGSRFRWINEQLYTTDSASALEMIKKQPELYEEYHKGFASQVESWPENPVDIFTRELIYRGVNKMVNAPGGLPGVNNGSERKVVVSDMGCGEANLAIEIDNFMEQYKKGKGKEVLKKIKKRLGGGKDVVIKNKKLDFEVHSFDLKKINDKITVADIKNVPMEDNSCSVVIFCLSLMGTNFLDFITEADRILIKGGELWITEIKSRLSDPKCTDFIKAIENLGFKLRNFDDENKMFTKFEFYKPLKAVKSSDIDKVRDGKTEGEWLLKPCIYKRR